MGSMPGVQGDARRPAAERVALTLAVVLHGASILLLPAVLGPRRDVAHSSGSSARIEIDIELLPPLRDGPALPEGTVAGAVPVGAPSRAGRAAAGSAAGAGEVLVAPEGYGEAPAPGPALPPDDYGPPEAGGGGYGIPGAGPPVWAIPGAVTAPGAAPAPTTPGSPRPVDPRIATRVLEGTLGASDRDKGLELEIGGVVARALEAAARQATLPHDCRASFEVSVGGGGEVLAVRHVSATAGDAASWRAVAERARASLSARRLPTRGRARRGAQVSVTVVSRFVDPGGSTEAGLLSNKSDVIHATYSVRVPDDKPMPAGAVKPIDTSSPFTKALPRGVAPVEHKSLDKGR
jgi:hypothetical protein